MNTIDQIPEIAIELLALDLQACSRCVASLENIEKALESIRPVLDLLDVRVQLKKYIIKSVDQARHHKFISSPTIRINGRDVVFETAENRCESCTDLSGYDGGIKCRVWHYRGSEFTEPPVALIVEMVLRELFGTDKSSINALPEYTDVPENIRRFFQSRVDAKESVAACSCNDAPEPQTCGCQ